MPQKKFHVADLVSITSGRVVSPRHIQAFYDVVDFVSGQKHWTHQLGRAAEEVVKPELLRQLPWLANIEPPALKSEKDVNEWAESVAKQYGEMHAVVQMSTGAYVNRDPVAELIEMQGPVEGR
ncbi:hypothetical protein [Saccharopolyspora griseoalba]|uniref:DUF7736 domain-containing protein n=1 Tax=Saccharopolyspora griseoalba TaxID=1431848 RepID=A0ABW2LSH0_9PSEU